MSPDKQIAGQPLMARLGWLDYTTDFKNGRTNVNQPYLYSHYLIAKFMSLNVQVHIQKVSSS